MALLMVLALTKDWSVVRANSQTPQRSLDSRATVCASDNGENAPPDKPHLYPRRLNLFSPKGPIAYPQELEKSGHDKGPIEMYMHKPANTNLSLTYRHIA